MAVAHRIGRVEARGAAVPRGRSPALPVVQALAALALLLMGVPAGATLAELFVLQDGNVLKPLPLLLMVAVIAYARRERTRRLIGHRAEKGAAS